MNASHSSRRVNRVVRNDGAQHLYAVGQAVRLKDGFAQRSQAPGVYRVTRRLPPRGEFPQYHIRNDNERYERLASQDELEAVNASSGGEGDALLERTFDRG
jgi:hypothetical protein